MPRVIPIGLATQLEAETNLLCQCLLLERADGLLVGLTSADVDVTVAGQLYLCDPGVNTSNIVISSGFNVANGEMECLENDLYMNKVDVLSGKWANARWTLFRCNPLDPAAGTEVILGGKFGDITIVEGGFKVELRSDLQKLQVTVGEVTSKTCKAELFDARCKVDEPSNTFTGTLTGVTNARIVTDSASAKPADWFGEALFQFTSGDCNGMRVKVLEYAAGVFTFVAPMLLTPAPGDTYVVKSGCRKRAYEDCRDKFNNILNNQSEPHLPGNDYLTNPGDVSNA